MARKETQVTTSPARTAPSPLRQPMVLREPAPVKPSARVAEMVGGTAAGCAAVCCCCPCTVLDFVVLAVVKVPTGLCKRAMRARRRKIAAKRKKEMGASEEGKERMEVEVAQVAAVERASPEEVAKMEMEVWAPFYGAGFWRSPSQKDER
ncbi:hypothetical protein FCM35_KLT13047 [Carex littledalei]|uniref:Uncharacterized protein n=1 Tax=Carex littledalei TaxID=544730 RepID=A0A833QG16_9POAL|nr:hypothetical protein FCM35_KLT13047 [Carex littledalei]